MYPQRHFEPRTTSSLTEKEQSMGSTYHDPVDHAMPRSTVDRRLFPA
jgi:hypothetical protein